MSECGPAILWSVMPIELVTEGLYPAEPVLTEVTWGGRMLQVQLLAGGEAQVVRLLSTNPQDYLDPRFQPGMRFRPDAE